MADEDNPFRVLRGAPQAPEGEDNPFRVLRGAPQIPEGEDNPFRVLRGAPQQQEQPEEGGSALSAMANVGRGLVAAVPSTIEGIIGLGASGVDLVFDTDTNRWVTERGEDVRDFLGLNVDDSAAGRAAEEVASFMIGFVPVVGWLGRAGAVARTGRAIQGSGAFLRSAERVGRGAFTAAQAGRTLPQALLTTRAGLIGTTALASGAIETMISRDGRATMADTFEFLPSVMQTEEYEEGMSGRDNAFRTLRNRLRRGAEGFLLSGAFDTALAGASAGTRAAMSTPVIGPGIAQSVGAVNRFISTGAAKAATLPGMRGATQLFNRYFSPSKGATRSIFEEADDAITFGDAGLREAIRQYERIENAIVEVGRQARRAGGGQLNMDRVGDDIFAFLLGNARALDNYAIGNANPIKDAAQDMMKLRRGYQASLMKEMRKERDRLPVGDPRRTKITQLQQSIVNNNAAGLGYLNRVFRMHDPNEARKFYEALEFSGPKYDAALDDVVKVISGRQYTRATAPQNVVDEAQRLIYEIMGLKAVSSVGPDAALAQLRESLKQGGAKKAGMVATDRPLLNLDESMFTARKDIIDKSPALRAFMGEITDPKQLYVTTINKLAKTAAAARFYRETAEAGLSVNISPQVLSRVASGERPALIQTASTAGVGPQQAQAIRQPFAQPGARPPGQPIPPVSGADELAEAETFLRQNGYIKLGEDSANSGVFGGEYGAMTGMFVPRELYDAITAPLTLSQHPLSEAVAILSQMRGLSQKNLIIPNVASRVRDIMGSFGFLVGNANVPRNMDPGALFQTLFGDLANLSPQGQRRLLRKLELSGTQNSNLLVSAIRDYISEGKNLGFSGKTARILEAIEDPKALGGMNAYGRILRVFEKLTENTDNVFKAAAVMSEEAKLVEALAKAGVTSTTRPTPQLDEIMQLFKDSGLVSRTSSQVLEELTPIEVMASEIVKNTMPNYRRIGTFVRGLDRIPLFGNFTSFASENIRNSINTVGHALREMSFTVPQGSSLRASVANGGLGEAGVRALEQNIRTLGAQRLMSFISMASTVPNAMVAAGMRSTGLNEKDMQDLSMLSQEYLRGHQLVPIENDGKGNIKVIDLSYVAPYGFVLDPARAAMQEYARQGQLGAGAVSQFTNAVWAAFSGYSDPFASEAIIFERIRDVLPESGPMSLGIGRGGKTATGATLYTEVDPLGDKVAAGFNHIVDGLMPAYLNLFLDEAGGDIRPGRLSRALSNTPGSRGQEFDSYEELARQFTGFTPLEINLTRDFEFNGEEYTDLRSQARGAANRMLVAADRTPQEMVSAFGDYVDNLYRIQSNLHAEAQAAMRLGVSRERIFRQLTKGAGMGAAEANNIINGTFFPRPVAVETIRGVARQLNEEGRRRLVSQLPVAEMNALVASRIGQPLRSTVDRDERPPLANLVRMGATETPGMAEPPRALIAGIGAAPAAPAIGPVPAAPGPQPSAQPARTAPPPLELLGSNPFEALRNLGVAQRPPNQ
jgi:hypothetical protein